MKFGADKCKLLVSGRPNKIKAVTPLLKDEPEVLTFYGTPVKLVEDYYVHIGVPQAPQKQSKVMVDYRISRGQDMSYKLQGSTQKFNVWSEPFIKQKNVLVISSAKLSLWY